MTPLEVPQEIRNEQGQFNPFLVDHFHMGIHFSRNITIMMRNHDTDRADYMVLVNRTTGERIWIDFPESWQ